MYIEQILLSTHWIQSTAKASQQGPVPEHCQPLVNLGAFVSRGPFKGFIISVTSRKVPGSHSLKGRPPWSACALLKWGPFSPLMDLPNVAGSFPICTPALLPACTSPCSLAQDSYLAGGLAVHGDQSISLQTSFHFPQEKRGERIKGHVNSLGTRAAFSVAFPGP